MTPNDKRGKLRRVKGPWPHCSYDYPPKECFKYNKHILPASSWK